MLLSRERQRVYWHFSDGKHTEKVLVKGNLMSKGGTAILEAALAGLGVAQLSKWMVERHLISGELVPVLPNWQASLGGQSSVYAVYKPSHYPNPLIRLFLDHLLAGEETQA